MSAKTSVPIGTTSVVGWSASVLAFGTALVAYLTGNHSAQTVTSVEAAGIGLVILGITHIGRYAQVRKIEATVLPPTEAILEEVKHYDPNLSAQVETYVKNEISKLEHRLTSEDPEPNTSGFEVSSAVPVLGGQEALKIQYGQHATSPTIPTVANS